MNCYKKDKEQFKTNLLTLPFGSFYVLYKKNRYLVTKQQYSKGKIIKIYAKELKGTDIVSGNYFLTIKNGLLKPCEMSDEKVISFVNGLEIVK
ncbi:MAG: peptide methionine sulfoxide reductase [Campylobacterota bacterium]|nr:peptide methionine sulfoxide reductase [Campylobacterota bacterium]